jgi:RNA-directed DNA polymerase
VSTEASARVGSAHSSDEVPETGWSEGAELFGFYHVSTIERWEERIAEAKPYEIDRDQVHQAWLRVKANGGAPGVDGQGIEDFERKLEDNLYKLWNRMSSGSYFPKPVRLCPIPKRDGGQRVLGIPTVTDRVAQMIGVLSMEPKVDPAFHSDSYGYRPGKSAHDAIGMTRQRCWRYNWVIDLDIKGYFDTINHQLLMKAVRRHVQEKWLLLYIERWLGASGVEKTGEQVKRTCGTPQGGVISPLLANLFLHYVFDLWMRKEFETVPFERYADDIIVHCKTEKQAHYVLEAIRRRLLCCGLAVNPQKTKIVYCKDGLRPDDCNHTEFTFLGFEFRARLARNAKTGQFFVGFIPAVSPRAKQEMQYIIRSWKLKSCATISLEDVAKQINPIVRGWINYYGRYCRSALRSVLRQVEMALSGWAIRKFKKMHRRRVESLRWLARVRKASPSLFAHWTVA